MNTIVDFPGLVFVLSFTALWLSALVGAFLSEKWRPLTENQLDGFGVVQSAVLTLLGLLIGFTFSMAVNRYEQRKNYEEAEANAIGTEYIRLGLLPAPDVERARGLLRNYLDQRVLFYTSGYGQPLQQIDNDTAQLQNQLWSTVQSPARAEPTAVGVLTVSGMNDVLNSQGYTQAAWWNRIPLEAWFLLAAIAIGCNLLIGYGAPRTSTLLIVFPLAVSVSFFLICDIDSPRRGLIRVPPQELVRLSQTLHGQ